MRDRHERFGYVTSWQPVTKEQIMPKKTKTETVTFKGQGTRCSGTLTITLSGPKGAGKSMVAKLLRAQLPLTPVADVALTTVVTE